MPSRPWPRLCAALLLVGACNVPTSAPIAASQAAPASSGVAVQFRPGVPLPRDAVEAPAKSSRLRDAASYRDLGSPHRGAERSHLTDAPLQAGVPLPIDVLTARAVGAKPPVATAIAINAVDAADVKASQRPLAELVGVYQSRTTASLLILRTDETYLISQHGSRLAHGRYSLQGQTLVLSSQAGDVQRLQPSSRDAWTRSESDGETFALLHAPNGGDAR